MLVLKRSYVLLLVLGLSAVAIRAWAVDTPTRPFRQGTLARETTAEVAPRPPSEDAWAMAGRDAARTNASSRDRLTT